MKKGLAIIVVAFVAVMVAIMAIGCKQRESGQQNGGGGGGVGGE